MLMIRSFVAVVQTVLLCCPTVTVMLEEHFAVIIPWWGTVETNGPNMGSSFMIAVKRLEYEKKFAIMPLRCDDQFSVTKQVQTLSVLGLLLFNSSPIP